jgi:hypothetical protein
LHYYFSDEFGEFVAEMIVVVDKVEYEGKEPESTTVESALKSTAQGGKLGHLKVDPQSLTMRAPSMIIVLNYFKIYH